MKKHTILLLIFTFLMSLTAVAQLKISAGLYNTKMDDKNEFFLPGMEYQTKQKEAGTGYFVKLQYEVKMNSDFSLRGSLSHQKFQWFYNDILRVEDSVTSYLRIDNRRRVSGISGEVGLLFHPANWQGIYTFADFGILGAGKNTFYSKVVHKRENSIDKEILNYSADPIMFADIFFTWSLGIGYTRHLNGWSPSVEFFYNSLVEPNQRDWMRSCGFNIGAKFKVFSTAAE